MGNRFPPRSSLQLRASVFAEVLGESREIDPRRIADQSRQVASVHITISWFKVARDGDWGLRL